MAATLCGGWRLLLSSHTEKNKCPVCGALFHRPGVWGRGSEKQYFCPACGVSLNTGEKQLDWNMQARLPKTQSKKQVAWEVGELPFPNPALVKQTKKPAAALKQLSRKQVKGFTGV